MDEIIKKGYAKFWGTSEWPAHLLKQVKKLCEEKNLVKPVLEQPQYNLLTREKIESEYSELF